MRDREEGEVKGQIIDHYRRNEPEAMEQTNKLTRGQKNRHKKVGELDTKTRKHGTNG